MDFTNLFVILNEVTLAPHASAGENPRAERGRLFALTGSE